MVCTLIMTTKINSKNKKRLIILISGMLLCFVLIAIASIYETAEIDQYSGRTRISYQVLCITVYSYENDTNFSKLAAKYVIHPPKWRRDMGLPVFSSIWGDSRYSYFGAIRHTGQIAFICSSYFDSSLEDKEALIQFALKVLDNYREDKHYFWKIDQHFEESRDGQGIKWKEFIEEMENDQK